MPLKYWLKRLDPYARKLGLYTSYQLTSNEYIGTVYCPEGWDITPHLKRAGYESIWFEAAKTHPETGAVHKFALRKPHGMMHDTPEEAAGTELLDGWHYGQRQWHVHGFRVGEYINLYSHYELRGDPWILPDESLRAAIARCREHYRPTYGETYLQGVACPEVEGLVNNE